jgi:hypothetical protein
MVKLCLANALRARSFSPYRVNKGGTMQKIVAMAASTVTARFAPRAENRWGETNGKAADRIDRRKLRAENPLDA